MITMLQPFTISSWFCLVSLQPKIKNTNLNQSCPFHLLLQFLVLITGERTFEHVMVLRKIILASLLATRLSAFSLHRHHVVRQDATFLAAKRPPKKKSKGKTSATGGGFGKVLEIPHTPQDDYAIFPALEAQVQQTILASPKELLEPGPLSNEIYDRLDQIYGFPNFNFQNSDGNASFEDLISAPSPASATSVTPSPSSKISDLDFADLLASATGDESPIPKAASQPVQSSNRKMEAIANLSQFSDFRVLNVDPLVLAVDDFFTHDECDRYIAMSERPQGADAAFQTRSKTVGKDNAAKSQRTSTTWFHHYKAVPELMAKASRLLGLDGIDCWEEAQTVRYRRNEKFTWHLDALSPAESSPSAGGQRTATLLVYLTDLEVSAGGATIFRDLSSASGDMLKVQPKKGSALLFFPAAGGIPNTPFDIRTLHCGEVVDASADHDKWISQLWLRETPYTPTSPPGNLHDLARDAISDYCSNSA